MEQMSSVEKEKFLYAMRWDPAFRNEMFEELIQQGEGLRSEIIDKAMKECEDQLDRKTEDFINDASGAVYDDLIQKVIDTFGEQVIVDIIDNVEDKIIDHFKQQISGDDNLKDRIVRVVVAQLASECLTIGDKEELRKKVHKEMVNKRSYREDLLDLDED